MSPAAPSFLVINVARIGDTLLATPAMRAIAAAYPGSAITALAHPKRAEVLCGLPFVSSVGGVTKTTAPWRGWWGARRYDYALVYGFDAPLVAYALRVSSRVVAFAQRDERLNRRLFRRVEEPSPGSENAVMHRLRLAAALGIPAAGARLAYRVKPEEAGIARERLIADLPPDASPLVGLNVATFPTKVFRRWPIEHFEALSRRVLAERPHAHFIVFGGSEELEATRWLKQRLGPRATVYAGRLTLRETAAIMSMIDVYLGLDTGLTHIMSAFDIPMVVLYHCRIPSRQIAPLGHPALYVLDHPRLGGDCSESTPMSEITVDTVFAAVARALREHPPRAQLGAR